MNLTFLPCFDAFFRYIRVNHQPYIHIISFFPKNVFCCYFCPFLSTKLFLHIYHVVTGGEIYDRPDNLANNFLLYVNPLTPIVQISILPLRDRNRAYMHGFQRTRSNVFLINIKC